MKNLDEYSPEIQKAILAMKRISLMLKEAKTPEELVKFEPIMAVYQKFLAINQVELKSHLENSLKNSP